jgi:hypothetical protein
VNLACAWLTWGKRSLKMANTIAAIVALTVIRIKKAAVITVVTAIKREYFAL